MRKIFTFFATMLVLFSLVTGVSAANTVTSAQAVASVAADSSCQVSLTVAVHMEQPSDSLFFPVPANALAISLNGNRVRAARAGEVRRVNLSRVMGKVAGDFSFHIQYSLRDVIQVTEIGTQQLQLPLLCGFDYTIEAMEFTVTLPGNIEAKPAFTSGYHKSSIEADLSCTVDGMTVTGSALKQLKDHETLTMLLDVSDEMFPRSIVETQTPTGAAVAMAICAGLALVYWLLTMRHLPLRRESATTPPEGYDAGALGCILGLQGVDLSMTVLTWAQLGYVMLCRERKGRIFIEKRMDMGNERSDFEQRCFQKLFAKKDRVDTGSFAYATLHRKLATQRIPLKELLHRHSGNGKIFRTLAAGIGLFGGAGIGIVIGGGAILQGLWIFLLSIAGAVSGWFIIGWAGSLLLHRNSSLLRGLILCGIWLLLSLIAGAFSLGLWMVIGLLVAGILLRIGGLRTSLGRKFGAQLRGLRHYLLRSPTATMRQRMETDPDFFFRMLPYAAALGVDKAFAGRFGNLRLGSCPYLTGAGSEGMTASQWCELLRKCVDAMELRARRLPTEKLVTFLRDLTKR